MVEATDLLNKHDDRITSLMTEVSIIKNDYHHLGQNVDKLIELTKKMEALPYKIQTMENSIHSLTMATSRLEELINKKTDFSGRFAMSSKKWMTIIGFLILISGVAMDILYKLPPPN